MGQAKGLVGAHIEDKKRVVRLCKATNSPTKAVMYSVMHGITKQMAKIATTEDDVV